MDSARARSSATSLPERPLDNLPPELTSFVGRDREVAEVKRLPGDRRLLTHCGPGGAGKTRLALVVAKDLVEEFENGVWWVELASISDPDLVPGRWHRRLAYQRRRTSRRPGRSWSTCKLIREEY